MGWVDTFKYYKSNFNTNETLTEFLLISDDRYQNTNSCFTCVNPAVWRSSAYFVWGVGKSMALVSSLVYTVGSQCWSVGHWGQSRSWLGTNFFLSFETSIHALDDLISLNLCIVLKFRDHVSPFSEFHHGLTGGLSLHERIWHDYNHLSFKRN